MSAKACLLPVLAAGAVCFLLGGCSYNINEVKAFLKKDRAPVTGVEYRVLPPDILEFRSRHIAEIDKVKQQVRPDGKINLPLLGEIMVAGKTPKEIEGSINDAAKDYYQEVDSTVDIAEYKSQNIFIFGQVAKAGAMPWTGRDTLLDVLAKAEPTYLAWPEQIIVVRGSDPQEGGHATSHPSKEFIKKYKETGIHPPDPSRPRHKMTINLYAMIREGDMDNNVYLLPDDVVFVQPNPAAAVGLFFQSLFMPMQSVGSAASLPIALMGM